MKLEGMKINFLGDSITEGHGVSCIENVYWNVIKREYGLKEARGYGIGGTRISKNTLPSENPIWDRDFLGRYEAMDDDADAVVIFGGTNDYGHGDAKIGEFADRTPYTFYGACHLLFEGIINKYPDATIIVMTPLHRDFEDEEREGYAPLVTYVNVIKEVAEYYSIPVLDLWSVSGMQPAVQVLKDRYMPDGLHPNDAGQRLIASRLAGFIETL